MIISRPFSETKNNKQLFLRMYPVLKRIIPVSKRRTQRQLSNNYSVNHAILLIEFDYLNSTKYNTVFMLLFFSVLFRSGLVDFYRSFTMIK